MKLASWRKVRTTQSTTLPNGKTVKENKFPSPLDSATENKPPFGNVFARGKGEKGGPPL